MFSQKCYRVLKLKKFVEQTYWKSKLCIVGVLETNFNLNIPTMFLTTVL
jgi:hypothetical protein